MNQCLVEFCARLVSFLYEIEQVAVEMNTEKEAAAATTDKENEEDAESLEYIETEPVLTYSRMKNDVAEILKSDSVSCIRTDHKILVLGTHWGRIHIMDHDGNQIMTKDCVSHQLSVIHCQTSDRGG